MTALKIAEIPERLVKQIFMEMGSFTDEKDPQIMAIWEGGRLFFFAATNHKNFYASVEACATTPEPIYLKLELANVLAAKKACGDVKRPVEVNIDGGSIFMCFKTGESIELGSEGFVTLYDPLGFLAKMREALCEPGFSFFLGVLSGKSRDNHVAVWAKDNALRGQAYLKYEYMPEHKMMKSAKGVAGFTAEAYATTRRKPQ